MASTTRPTLAPASRQASAAPHPVRLRLRTLGARGKRAAVARVLAPSVLVAGPAAPSTAAESPAAAYQVAEVAGALGLVDTERVLGARLASGYSGAVPAADVESLVQEVGRRLREEGSPASQLADTTEAVSRLALTDFLTRGTPLPLG